MGPLLLSSSSPQSFHLANRTFSMRLSHELIEKAILKESIYGCARIGKCLGISRTSVIGGQGILVQGVLMENERPNN